MKKQVIVSMKEAMDATPIANLVALANNYRSRIYLESGKSRVNAKSIMGMMSLVLISGTEVTVDAEGEDENDALVAVEKYLTT